VTGHNGNAPAAGQLAGQTVVVISGTSGIGLETARLARAMGADLVLAARDPNRLQQVGAELDAATASFDATNFVQLDKFFDELPAPMNHLLTTEPGPYYAPLAEFDLSIARRSIEAHLFLPFELARHAVAHMPSSGTLLFMSGTAGRKVAIGLSLVSAMTAALTALTKSFALEIAPIRVNSIAAGFVDTPLSEVLLGDGIEARRQQLAQDLPIHRVVTPLDVANLAVHLMLNTAVTGATFDIDGGQQLL
jgi:NAD(P)-dependent dehydrogenase (short-subunit alcohol dehydrogenase family)